MLQDDGLQHVGYVLGAVGGALQLVVDVSPLDDVHGAHFGVKQVGAVAGGGGRPLDAVDADGGGGALHEVHDVVHTLGEGGDILAVQGCHEGEVHLPVELVGDVVGLVLQVFHAGRFHLHVVEVLKEVGED